MLPPSCQIDDFKSQVDSLANRKKPKKVQDPQFYKKTSGMNVVWRRHWQEKQPEHLCPVLHGTDDRNLPSIYQKGQLGTWALTFDQVPSATAMVGSRFRTLGADGAEQRSGSEWFLSWEGNLHGKDEEHRSSESVDVLTLFFELSTCMRCCRGCCCCFCNCFCCCFRCRCCLLLLLPFWCIHL